jgi:uncharacterized protein
MLINNAGFGSEGRFWEATLELQVRMLRLHIIATMRLSYAALGNMVPQGSGVVINVASVSAWMRRPGFIAYAASKSWIAAFTEGLYLDLRQAGSNVVVQALCPGLVYTEFHDRMGLDRKRLGSATLWQTPQKVVSASLEGLRRKRLFVIPGWRYRLLTGVLWKLPAAARLKLQSLIMSGRGGPLPTVPQAYEDRV